MINQNKAVNILLKSNCAQLVVFLDIYFAFIAVYIYLFKAVQLILVFINSIKKNYLIIY